MISYNKYVSILALVLTLFSFNIVSGQEGVQHGDYFGAETVAGDFNGDGYADLAVGAISDWDIPTGNVGIVNVLYGSPSGIDTNNSQFWKQSSLGLTPKSKDFFGGEMAVGDFNGDSYDDLAIAEPLGTGDLVKPNAGSVVVLYGSNIGLTNWNMQHWHQNSPGIADSQQAADAFGTAMIAADFDSDGYDELVVSAPGESGDLEIAIGLVHIIPGSEAGLTSDFSYILHQDLPMLPGSETRDIFGYSLTAGDFDGDNHIDLAVGVPGKYGHGAVDIFFNTGTGLTNWGWQELVPFETHDYMYYGKVLASGDFNHDGIDDIAIAAPEESVNEKIQAGAVHVILGSNVGFDGYREQLIHQDLEFIPDEAERVEHFGGFESFHPFGGGAGNYPAMLGFRTLAVGDINGDHFDDLFIGNPKEQTFNGEKSSEAMLLYGSSGGILTSGVERWHQGIAGIEGSIVNTAGEGQNYFGSSIITGDFDNDGCADVAIGALFNQVKDYTRAGTVHVIYNKSHFGIGCDGLSGSRSEMWSQNIPGVFPGIAYENDILSLGDETTQEIPRNITLSQNYPNPFNPSTEIAFSLPADQLVSLVVYDMLGREVATLANQVFSAGNHSVAWDAGTLPTGMYLYKLSAGDFSESRLLTLAK